MSNYGIVRELAGVDYDDAVKRTTVALKEEGFGVLTEIDVRATLKQKLDVDFRRYVILGACNPPLAHQALITEPLIGLLLPCNIVVSESENGSTVAMLKPTAIFALVDKEEIQPLAEEVEAKLSRVLMRL